MQNNPGDDPGPFAIPPDDASRMILQPDPVTAEVEFSTMLRSH